MSSYVFDGNTSQYRVTLHDSYKRDRDSKAIIRYSLRRLSDNAIIFSGKDLHCSPLHTPASKETAIALLNFLTTPDDSYTPDQLEWCGSLDAEELSYQVCVFEESKQLHGYSASNQPLVYD